MPFTTRPRPFNRIDIESLNRNQQGVYGLFREGQWIYIGKGDLRERLLAHLIGDNPCITRLAPTHWVGEVTANMDAREAVVIQELRPLCNKQKLG